MAKVRTFYKRDKEGKFAKVNTLTAKLAQAKAQGVKHVDPGPVPNNKLPKGWGTIKVPAAKTLGAQLYADKKAGKFKDDGEIFKAAGKLANAYKKSHPTAGQGLSANMVVAAYKQHEYDETGKVILLGEVLGKLDNSKAPPSKPSKPTVDKSPKGIGIASSEKFSKPGALKPTGVTLGGVNGAKVYEDDKGQKWVVKQPKAGSNAYGNANFLVDLEIAASRIQNRAGLKVPAAHKEMVDGKPAAVSKMYDGATPLFADGSGKEVVDLASLTPRVVLKLQQQQVLDWLLSNHDSHSGNFLATEDGIVGIDKGQSFKFFGKDKLHWSYTGTTPLNPNVPTYQTLWKQFIKGEGDLHDPSQGELHTMIQRTQAIPDADYKKLLRPYATQAAADGKLSAVGATPEERVENFLTAAVARKNNLQTDFDELYKAAVAQQKIEAPKSTGQKRWAELKSGDKIQVNGQQYTVDYVGASGIPKNKILVIDKDGKDVEITKLEYEAAGATVADDALGEALDYDEVVAGDWVSVAGTDPVKIKSTINKIVAENDAGGIITLSKAMFENKMVKAAKDPNKKPPAKKTAAKKAVPEEFKLVKGQSVKADSQQGVGYDNGTVTGVNASGTIATVKFDNDPDMEYEYHWIPSQQQWIDDPSAAPEEQSPLAFGTQEQQPLATQKSQNFKTMEAIVDKGVGSSKAEQDIILKLISDAKGLTYGEKQELLAYSKKKWGTGPTPPPAAPSAPPTAGKSGEPATFDKLAVGSIYHVPGGKKQKVIAKTATSFTAQSVSGNTHEYTQEKFDKYANDKGVLIGDPDDKPVAPLVMKDITAGDQFTIATKDAFGGPPGGVTITITKATGYNLSYKASDGSTGTVNNQGELDEKKWKAVPPKTPWEKYALGDISYEEYVAATGGSNTDEAIKPKLGAKQGPALPTPVEVKETKAPPTWDKIPAEALPIGRKIWERKQQGEFTSDSHMWSEIGKALTKWKKNNPGVKAPSQNAVRNAARRFEFDKNGSVAWTEEATAQVVENKIETPKSLVAHKPVINRVNRTGKLPLTAFGDVSAPPGSYMNPHAFGDFHNVTEEMANFGKKYTPQTADGLGVTQAQLQSVKEFTGSHSGSINSFINYGNVHYGDGSYIKKQIENMDAVFNAPNLKPLEDWTIVTRGVGTGHEFGIDSSTFDLESVRAQIGKTVVKKAFTSTSLSNTGALGSGARIIYRLPPGFKPLWVGGETPSGKSGKVISGHKDEREMILPRNTKYKIISADKRESGNGYDVVVEVVGVEE